MAANAAAIAAYLQVHFEMSDYLENTLGVANPTLRFNIMSNGFRTAANLVNKEKGFVHKLCQNVRKNSAGTAINRSVTAELEEELDHTLLWIKCRYQTQRSPSLVEATVAQVEAVSTWSQELIDSGDPDPTSVAKYTDRTQAREWFETILAFLGEKLGRSGYPVLYVVRKDQALPAVDAGFGLPSFEADLEQRGRVGAGTFWRADNNFLFTFLRSKCHGTTAWNSISSLAATRNGRAAFWILKNLFLGPDTRQILLSEAEHFLDNARFDGRSRNFTFTKFLSKLRQAFQDLGPDDQMSEQRKVTKFMQAFQVPGYEHLDASVTGDPNRSRDFETAVAFVASQISTKKTKNTGALPGRNISAFGRGNGNEDGGYKKKQLGDRKRDPPHKKNQRTKFNSKKPAEYLSKRDWDALTGPQRDAAIKARAAKGIPTRQERLAQSVDQTSRSLGALSISRDDMDISDDEEEEAPVKCRTISMTQRNSRDVSQHRPNSGAKPKKKST